MSQPPFGDPGVCPWIALFSSTTNQSPIGGTFSTTWSRLKPSQLLPSTANTGSENQGRPRVSEPPLSSLHSPGKDWDKRSREKIKMQTTSTTRQSSEDEDALQPSLLLSCSARGKNWSRAGHAGFAAGVSQTHPTPNHTWPTTPILIS